MAALRHDELGNGYLEAPSGGHHEDDGLYAQLALGRVTMRIFGEPGHFRPTASIDLVDTAPLQISLAASTCVAGNELEHKSWVASRSFFERVGLDGGLRILRYVPLGYQSYESQDLAGQFMAARAAYVRSKHWNTGNQLGDYDRYDGELSTTYVVASKPDAEGGQQFAAGARFTRVSSIESSLTWEMLRDAPAMKLAAQLDDHGNLRPEYAEVCEAAARGALYDMTRLVVAEGMGYRESLDVIFRIFGAGYVATQRGSEGCTWVFLITDNIRSLLDGMGINVTELAKGKASPDDEYTSYLCAVNPECAFRALASAAPGTLGRRAYDVITSAAQSVAVSEDAAMSSL